jgi:transcriptional regulator with XRE-family HTH domain
MKYRIKELRNLRKWSQTRLAEESNLSLRMIQHIENGTRQPSDESLNALAKVFGIPPIELFEDSVRPFPNVKTPRYVAKNFSADLLLKDLPPDPLVAELMGMVYRTWFDAPNRDDIQIDSLPRITYALYAAVRKEKEVPKQADLQRRAKDMLDAVAAIR